MTNPLTTLGAAPPRIAGQRIRVRHLTRFEYMGPVTESYNEVRLRPVNDELQSCSRFELRISPDVAVREYGDIHGNRVHYFDIPGSHDRLEVEAISVVETKPDARPLPIGPFAPSLLDDPSLGIAHYDFLTDTSYVPLADALRVEAKRVLGGAVTDLWAASVAFGEHVHGILTYTPNSTKVNTRVLDVLETRCGVCQDYAHLMVGLCRSIGIPARYISGYFLNPSRKPGDIEASHAWVEVLLPGYGWRGYDPTHRRMPGTNYVKLAVGRDYGDIRPVGGTFRGRGTKEMSVEVHVDSAD